MPKTKIICTLGPSSSKVTVIWEMMSAGMDAARLNFSHGIPREHKARIEIVRELNKKYRRHIKILQDLEGSRIRIGLLKSHKPILLKKRQELYLTQANIIGQDDKVSFDYQGALTDIRVGNYIYIDDGNISLVVKERRRKLLKTQVVRGGLLKEIKGVNIPEAKLKFPLISDKDKLDIKFGIENRVDYIAQSFVRAPEDILCIRKMLRAAHFSPRLIAKIENREGIKNIAQIIDVSDGIMIARGDMGICVPIYQIPIIQKQIIKKCNQARKFVITATQMLESMTENILPTRAEVTDVANAIIDGTDFVMLSGETAAGKHPVETVRMMNQIVKFTEENYPGAQKPRSY